MVGGALTSDAHHITAPAPDGDGARRAMLHALCAARMKPEAVDVIFAHATGTLLNDATETRAKCGRVIHLGIDGYTRHPNADYSCEVCGAKEMRRILAAERQGRKKRTRVELMRFEFATATPIFFLIRIDDFILNKWHHPSKADVISTVVGDFSGWDKDAAKSDTMLQKLLKALKAESGKT